MFSFKVVIDLIRSAVYCICSYTCTPRVLSLEKLSFKVVNREMNSSVSIVGSLKTIQSIVFQNDIYLYLVNR